MKALTPKQRAFVEHYLACGWNATEAAKRAGYSAKTAQEQGSRLLSNVMVKALVEQRMGEMALTANEVLARLAEHARGSIADFMVGNNLDLQAARESGKLHLAKKIKRTTRSDDADHLYTTLEIELYDAQAALVHLGRHHKLFTDKVEVEHDWRKEATAAGVDPDGLVNELFAKVKRDAGNSAD